MCDVLSAIAMIIILLLSFRDLSSIAQFSLRFSFSRAIVSLASMQSEQVAVSGAPIVPVGAGQPLSPPPRVHLTPQIQFYSSPSAMSSASSSQYSLGLGPVPTQQAPGVPAHLLPGTVSPPAQTPGPPIATSAPAVLSAPPPPPPTPAPTPTPSLTPAATTASVTTAPAPVVARAPPCVPERTLEQLARQVDPYMQMDEDVSQVRALAVHTHALDIADNAICTLEALARAAPAAVGGRVPRARDYERLLAGASPRQPSARRTGPALRAR